MGSGASKRKRAKVEAEEEAAAAAEEEGKGATDAAKPGADNTAGAAAKKEGAKEASGGKADAAGVKGVKIVEANAVTPTPKVETTVVEYKIMDPNGREFMVKFPYWCVKKGYPTVDDILEKVSQVDEVPPGAITLKMLILDFEAFFTSEQCQVRSEYPDRKRAQLKYVPKDCPKHLKKPNIPMGKLNGMGSDAVDLYFFNDMHKHEDNTEYGIDMLARALEEKYYVVAKSIIACHKRMWPPFGKRDTDHHTVGLDEEIKKGQIPPVFEYDNPAYNATLFTMMCRITGGRLADAMMDRDLVSRAQLNKCDDWGRNCLHSAIMGKNINLATQIVNHNAVERKTLVVRDEIRKMTPAQMAGQFFVEPHPHGLSDIEKKLRPAPVTQQYYEFIAILDKKSRKIKDKAREKLGPSRGGSRGPSNASTRTPTLGGTPANSNEAPGSPKGIAVTETGVQQGVAKDMKGGDILKGVGIPMAAAPSVRTVYSDATPVDSELGNW